MNEFDIDNIFPEEKKTPEPIPFDDSNDTDEKPIDIGETDISHTPLDLGDTPITPQKTQQAKQVEEIELDQIEGLEDLDQLQPPKTEPVTKQTVSLKPQPQGTGQMVSAGRITAMKTFFTKLHAGSIEFIEEQIARWLKNNPDIVIKSINVISGPVVGKKTEPSIIITLWY